ncbi:hypothetical protein ACJMK2_026969, partial [Sinanodonta woodiana]
MGLTCGGKLSIFFLVSLNGLFLLFGIGLLVIGIIMRVNAMVFVGPEVMKLLNIVGFNGVTLATVASSLSIFSICLGCFIIVEAGLGAFGACCKVRCMLVVYAVIVGILLLAEIAVVILWASMRDKVDGVAKAAMINVLKMYAGPSATDEISVAWNLLFVGMECCGVVGPLVSHVEFENTKWISGSSSIPYSCCIEATMSNYATGTNIQCEEMSANIYRKT